MLGRVLVSGALWLCCPVTAAAQSIYAAETLRALPIANVFSLIETAQPEVTTDRFNSGGLNAGEAERASAFLASWSQTSYVIGDASISSPLDGTPMLFLQASEWSGVAVNPVAGGGLMVGLSPLTDNADRWGATIEATGSGGALSRAASPARPPAISALGNYARLSGAVSGVARHGSLAFVVGGTAARAVTFDRRRPRVRDAQSGFANAIYTVSPSRLVRATAFVQQDAWHLQSTYDAAPLRMFANYTQRRRAGRPSAEYVEAERLNDGPIPSLVEPASTERRVAAGAVFSKRYARHSLAAGVDVSRSSATVEPTAPGTIAERIDGMPARMWRFAGTRAPSRRHAVEFSVYGSHRVFLTKTVEFTAGLRFETADASASGAAGGLAWRTLLPSAHLDWNIGTPLRLEFTTGVARFADRPLLGLLAYGDPNAPTADVSRWDGATLIAQPLVMRVGPGTGGDETFSRIDPELTRTVTDQFLLQMVSTPWRSVRLRVTGLARRQWSLIGVINTGVPFSSYTMFTIPDANADWVQAKDDQQLPVYERRPETFGQDRYLLTNPDVEDATMGAFIVAAEVDRPSLLFRIGGTASASVGPGGNRGFTAGENDQSMLGELFTNPNAHTYARGRLFNDRAYTIKTLAMVRLPARTSVGAIARYQDGQPFSRLAIVPGLSQGAEAVQAFPRGRSRFSYRATVDVRLTKSLTLRKAVLDLIVDGYNVLNAASEVEEYVVTGPRFREITAIQPPPSIHLGARVTF